MSERRDRSALARHPTAASALLGATVLTLLVYLVPTLEIVAWPLLLISTLVHECGHGLTALLLGADFEALLIWPDASGVAAYRGELGRLGRALIAFGGLLGPPLAAAGLFFASREPRTARRALGVFAVALVAIALLWVRNAFGLIFVTVLAAGCAGIALRLPAASQFTSVFLAIQLSLSVFSRADYLFVDSALTAHGRMPSDTAQIAAALWLPYWVWGTLVAVASILLLAWGLRSFLRSL